MAANEPYIAHVNPIERALDQASSDAPIQAMLCGTIERMRRAEARLLEHPGIGASGHPSGRSGATMNGAGSETPSSPNGPGAPSFAVSSQRVGCTNPDAPERSAQSNRPGAPSFAASSQRVGCTNPGEPEPIITLNRTDYPARDLSILDILPAGCSKGAALLSLAHARGIVPAQILAIGDNWNDVSMLEAAGTAILMDNAPDDLKAFARTRGWRIGPSNRADGVADAIEDLLAVGVE